MPQETAGRFASMRDLASAYACAQGQRHGWGEGYSIGRDSFLNLLSQLETNSTRRVTIATRPTLETVAKCDPQHQCLLFELPAELRMGIYELALVPHLYCNGFYIAADEWYRPEQPGRMVTDTNLLLTCRLIWLEANHLALELADFPFWLGIDKYKLPYWAQNMTRRGIPKSYQMNEVQRMMTFERLLTPNNRAQLNRIRVFTATARLESIGNRKSDRNLSLLLATLAPKTLTITVRHESMSERLNQDDMRAVLFLPVQQRVREIRLEIEAVEKMFADIRRMKKELQSLTSVPRWERIPEDSVEQRGCWTLQADLPERTWSTPFEPNGFMPLLYRTTTLVWKANDLRSVSIEDQKRLGITISSFMECKVCSHQDESTPQSTAEKTAASAKHWKTTWQKEGSLLELLE